MTKQKAKPTPPEIDLSGIDTETLIRVLEDRGELSLNGNGATRKDSRYFDEDAKLSIIAESMAVGVKEAADKHGLGEATIYNWRSKYSRDPGFKKALEQKTNSYRDDWRLQSSAAIRSCLEFIYKAGQVADPNNPASVRAVAGALKMAGEFGLAVDITYSRLGKDREAAALLADGADEDSYVITPVESVVEGAFEDIQELE